MTTHLSRRQFFAGLSAIAGSSVVNMPAIGQPRSPEKQRAAHPKFTFVHFTDPHIQPELEATEGTLKCFEQINGLRPDFAIAGGDLIWDAMGADKTRSVHLFDLYQKTAKVLGMPVHSVLGNHDVFGIYTASGASPSDPLYGKKLYEDRMGARFYSFDHKGWHFVILDTLIVTPDHHYVGHLDEQQMEWLRSDLQAAGRTTPVVIAVHIPLVTTWVTLGGYRLDQTQGAVVDNAHDVLELIKPYNVRAVLQGHTHINENVMFNDMQFITSGAVSGNWWHGVRAGTPEGYGVLKVDGNKITYRYLTYGWLAKQTEWKTA